MGHTNSPEDGAGVPWPAESKKPIKTAGLDLGDLSTTPTGTPHKDRYFEPLPPPPKKKPGG